MFNAIVINEIIDGATGRVYVAGTRVRVLLKTTSEYIGTIKNIFANEFSFLVDGEEKIIKYDSIDKMRLAEPDENFYNCFNF